MGNMDTFIQLNEQIAPSSHSQKLSDQDNSSDSQNPPLMLQLLSIAALDFLSIHSLSDMYQLIVEHGRIALQADYGSLFLYQDGFLERIYASSAELFKMKPRKKGILIKSFLEKHITVHQINNRKEFHPRLVKMGLKTAIYIPLYNQDQAIGMVVFLIKKRRILTDQEINLIHLFSSLASMAIINARLRSSLHLSIQSRDLIISMTSHEIRNPLTTIGAYINLIKQEKNKKNTVRLTTLDNLTHEYHRLVKLVESSLSVNKVQIGALQYDIQPCNVMEVVQRSFAAFQLQHPDKKVIIRNRLNRKQAYVMGDRDKLMQVIINLLNNANKFSSKDSKIIIRVWQEDKYYGVQVIDQGQGIAQSKLPFIFDKYYQINKDQVEGQGLGLYLVKTITNHHRGVVTVQSKVGQGTKFTIKLPK